MFAKLKRIEWRHWLFLLLCVVSVLVAIFCYKISLLRLWEALCDLWQSVLYYVRAVGGDPDGAAALFESSLFSLGLQSFFDKFRKIS